jgi:hypothetical protein
MLYIAYYSIFLEHTSMFGFVSRSDNMYGSLLGTFVLGTVWTYMVSSLEMFTALSDSMYCRSAFN